MADFVSHCIQLGDVVRKGIYRDGNPASGTRGPAAAYRRDLYTESRAEALPAYTQRPGGVSGVLNQSQGEKCRDMG